MSLINDALKRAKLAQEQAPPPALPGLHLRPVEPVPYVRHGVEFLVPTALAVVALLVLFLVWLWARQSGPLTTPVNAQSPASSAQAPPPQIVPAGESSKMPAPPAGSDIVAAPSSSSSEPVAIPVLAQPTPSTETVQSPPPLNSDVIKTQLVAGVAPEPPKATPLKLQGILFNPTRPSAVINGKPLFVGDRIRDFKVIAISRDSATLASSGETNVLNLSE